MNRLKRIDYYIFTTIIIAAFAMLNASIYENIVNVPENNSPISSAVDTVDATGSSIKSVEFIANHAQWNIIELNITSNVDTLVMTNSDDYLENENSFYRKYTGQIIICNPNVGKAISIGFPGTDFLTMKEGNLSLSPAFHDTLFYKTTGDAVLISIMYTTTRVDQ